MSDTMPGKHLGPNDAGTNDPRRDLSSTPQGDLALERPLDADGPLDETAVVVVVDGTVPGEPGARNVMEAARQQVVCPECGSAAEVTVNRRESGDFCPRCDFPLFWVRAEVLLDRNGTEESLRRLPGMAGRVSVGSAACPTCAESNAVNATNCLRCGGLMVLPTPPKAPRLPPPPPPVPQPEPEPEPRGQWIWVVAGVTAALLLFLVAYLLLR